MTDDLIRRADAIKAIEKMPSVYDGWSNAYEKPFIIETLEEVPSAEPKRGEWMPFEYGDDTWHKCSVCGVADKYRGSMPRPNGTIAEWEYVRNFCPNCGADMRKGAEDE